MHTSTPDTYTLSLHDALPIFERDVKRISRTDQEMKPDEEVLPVPDPMPGGEQGNDDDRVERKKIGGERDEEVGRSEEHTSELQSRRDLVCRLLLEKKKQY